MAAPRCSDVHDSAEEHEEPQDNEADAGQGTGDACETLAMAGNDLLSKNHVVAVEGKSSFDDGGKPQPH